MSGLPTNISTPFDRQPPPDPPHRPLVLFLDECIPRDLGERLAAFLSDRENPLSVIHLLDLYRQGVEDVVWAKRASTERWLPISADRGKSNRGEKLPAICKSLGLVNISLSAKVHALPSRDKLLAIIGCWLEIEEVWRNRIGCTHSLRFNDRKTAFRLVDIEAQKNRNQKSEKCSKEEKAKFEK